MKRHLLVQYVPIRSATLFHVTANCIGILLNHFTGIISFKKKQLKKNRKKSLTAKANQQIEASVLPIFRALCSLLCFNCCSPAEEVLLHTNRLIRLAFH